MPAITIGVTGALWGVDAQTGIICQSYGAKVNRDKNIVKNESGEDCLKSFYNPIQTHNVAGVYTGNTGIGAASPGFALALTNANAANGVSTGGIYCDDVDISKVNTDFKKITATATQAPLIP